MKFQGMQKIIGFNILNRWFSIQKYIGTSAYLISIEKFKKNGMIFICFYPLGILRKLKLIK